MDSKICAALSVVVSASLLPRDELLRLPALKAWLGTFAIAYALVKIYRILVYPHFVSPLRHLPGPKNNHFLVGQTIRLMTADGPNEVFQEWVRKWPDAPLIRWLSLGNSELLLVNSVAAHQGCMQTHGYDFSKADFFEQIVGEIIPGGLLFSNGEEHKKQRRLLAGPFSPPKIRKLVPVFQARARDFVGLLRRHIDASDDGITEVTSYFSRMTLDVIGVTILGIELDQLKSSSSMNFHECYHTMLEQPYLGGLISFLNAFVPMRWLPLETNRRFVRANDTIKTMIRSVVRQRIREIEEKKAGGATKSSQDKDANETRNLLTYMLEEEMPGKGGLTETQITENLFQFMAAGHDTTACALVFATYILATRPELQDRLRKEVLQALAEYPDPAATVIEGLKFLNNFTREVIRVYSPTIASPREAKKDVVVEGTLIPKGTTIIIVPGAAQRNPSVWGPDADEFDPDRWDRLAGDAASPYAFVAFSNGPRICPGKHYAILEIKTVLVELVRSFEIFAVVGMEPVAYLNPALTLKPKGGMRVVMKSLVV